MTIATPYETQLLFAFLLGMFVGVGIMLVDRWIEEREKDAEEGIAKALEKSLKEAIEIKKTIDG